MVSREKVFRALNHQTGEVPWIELRIDNQIAGQLTGKLVDCVNDVGDWIEVANKIGLDCANVRCVNRFGTEERIREGAEYSEFVPLLRDWGDLERVGNPLPDEAAILGQIKRATTQQPADELAVIGVTAGCVDPTALSMGFENFFLKLYDEIDFVETVLDLYTDYWEALAEILSASKEIDLLWYADDMACDTGPYLGPKFFKELILPRYRRVIRKTAKPWIFHSDGDLTPVLKDLMDLGMSGLHPIQPGPLDIFRLKKEIGDQLCLIGNVDLHLLSTGSPEMVREQVQGLLEYCAQGGGYILSSSNSIPDWVDAENLWSMSETLEGFNVGLRSRSF
jgi:uroporphyrinogen-III decarboxylase